ncbi:hypothetical protein HK098_001491 [Nowakowskiella sp. JEL0407]|nr:hypothetical protein HK098_001491 [Nowakowskiella sp. JEL0407]
MQNSSSIPFLAPSPESLSALAFNLIPELELCEWFAIVGPPTLYFSYSSLYYCLSRLRLTRIELHRLPTNQPGRRPNKVTIGKVIKACAITLTLQMITATVLTYYTRPKNLSEMRMEQPHIVILKLFAAFFMLDTYEYWVHRYFHENKYLYRKFHSVHHELTAPFAFGALYNHPLESFLMDIVGSGLTSVILDMHPWTASIFYCISTLKTVDDHCGYLFPWHPLHILFPNNAKFHDIHHWGRGVRYNYSQPFFTWWDHWMGTEFEGAMKRKALKGKLPTSDENEDDSEHEADVQSLLNSLEISKDALDKSSISTEIIENSNDSSIRKRK